MGSPALRRKKTKLSDFSCQFLMKEALIQKQYQLPFETLTRGPILIENVFSLAGDVTLAETVEEKHTFKTTFMPASSMAILEITKQ